MTEKELRQKWTCEEFERWKAEGIFGQSATYERYLEMRRWQEAEAARVLQELTEYYGEPPNEQPPELTEEDRRLLSEAWAEAARTPQAQSSARGA